jgi:hypothetical protein
MEFMRCMTDHRIKPLSALSLRDEGLNALNGKNPSAAGWFSRPIKCQILARMRISDFQKKHLLVSESYCRIAIVLFIYVSYTNKICLYQAEITVYRDTCTRETIH